MISRRQFLKTVGVVPLLGLANSLPGPWVEGVARAADGDLQFKGGAGSGFGDWWAEVKMSPGSLQPGGNIRLDVFIHLAAGFIPAMVKAGYSADSVLMLVTSERCFDADGWMRLPGDEKMSTILTPAGLAIEGGSTGAISKSAGSRFRNPVDQLQRVLVRDLQKSDADQWARTIMDIQLPGDTPPGIYRLRFDFGVVASRRYYSLNAEGFANRPRLTDGCSMFYSPTIPCSGTHVSGRPVDATKIQRHLYWALLGQYNSNGYTGVVADEDAGHFALSGRNIIPDEVILPLYDGGGTNRISYSLEPDFRTDAIDELRNVPWNNGSGELSVQVTDPSGNTTDFGTAPFVEKKGRNPTTKNPKFTSWKPTQYGLYSVVSRGWIADQWGNRYQGGGTYHFWIAKRMTMGTATFQGMSYPVGTRYGRDIGFFPAVPADVSVKADLYPNSDPSAVKTLSYDGKATSGGMFGASQGMKPFVFDVPGEYHAHILATYTDAEKHLWVCSMRHAGVVYPGDGNLAAHGKMVKAHDKLVERGETNYEGYVEPNDTEFRHLDHINFPYNGGDCLLIASEGDGANKIEPVMTYALKDNPEPYDPKLQPIGNTNVRIATSNGMSPHLYPEYITELNYYYGAGARPGFMGRFLVGEDGVRAPYWPVSATSFGGQIGASNNGDMPGEIYRLMGGVVLRPKDNPPAYAGYLASGFILPKGSNNNRVVAPGSEEILCADGRKAKVMLVSLRPGMVYDVGATFAPAFQIDPILPAHISCTLRAPDGTENAWEGVGDGFGSYSGADRVPLDQPGLWIYTVQADWNGNPAIVPGLPDDGGYIYVLDKIRPEGAAGLRLALKNQQSFKLEEGLNIEGFSNADSVYYAMVTPGCVIDQGSVPVDGGHFQYRVDPAAIHAKVPVYDIENRRSGKKETNRVIHLTFLAQQKAADGTPYWAFSRVIIRGTTAIYTS